MEVADVAADLAAEQSNVDSLVAGLSAEEWATPTPSPGWDIADQIGHLTYFDEAAALAITDREAFGELLAASIPAFADGLEAFDRVTLQRYRDMAPPRLLDSWRSGRNRLAGAAATLNADSRVPWYGPSMGAKSFLTARLMEAWAHGHDIAAAAGADYVETDRIRHIVRLGFITRGWSYRNRSQEPPDGDVRLELTAPSGVKWDLGPAAATESVSGPAVDFCLVVTQRRHLEDTRLDATPLARHWLLIAQAFAGPPTDGPAGGERV